MVEFYIHVPVYDMIKFIKLIAKIIAKKLGKPCILSLFPNLFNKFNNTWAHK